jgi:hypothetical protein
MTTDDEFTQQNYIEDQRLVYSSYIYFVIQELLES